MAEAGLPAHVYLIFLLFFRFFMAEAGLSANFPMARRLMVGDRSRLFGST